jgi:hypothetical protein
LSWNWNGGVGMNVCTTVTTVLFDKGWVNKFMGGTIYVLAGNVYNWQNSTMCYTIPILTYLDMMKRDAG